MRNRETAILWSLQAKGGKSSSDTEVIVCGAIAALDDPEYNRILFASDLFVLKS